MKVSELESPTLVAGAGLLVGLIGDLLFYENPIGISFLILMAMALVALVTTSLVQRQAITWANMWLALPLLYFAIMSAVRAEPFLRFMNISGALLLMALLTNRLLAEPLAQLNIGGYVANLLRTSIVSSLVAPEVVRQAISELRSEEGSRQVARRVLIGLLIATPFLCIFALLFAAADQLFSLYLEDFVGDIGDAVGHAFLTAGLSWVAIGGLAHALTHSDPPQDSDEAESQNRFRLKNLLGSTEAIVALFSIDLLFLVFVGIQFAALFGGEAFLERQGLTYSEYARQGFFELLTVALITLGFILSLEAISRRETNRQRLGFLVGSGLMITLTIIILVSAFQRLRLYELAFGFTRLRVNAHVFMVWLALLIAASLALLLVRRIRLFATASLLAAIGFTATMNILNPDVFIVRHNLRRYEAGEELDVEYIGSLSADVVPEMTNLLFEEEGAFADEIGPWLRMHLVRLDSRERRAGWPSAHNSLDRAYRLLDAERATIEQYEAAYRFGWD